MKIILLAVVVHLIFLASVFDIYFTTPIVHGIPFEQNVFPPPAKRLVLFVADGMRADTFYRLSANKTYAPFLRNVIEKTGKWGVSHTRVPTESRPGHVALIAGLYEDPSAITKGWKENPVEFDSVFNRSTFTWAWGSPDILPMFSIATGSRMWTEMYAAEEQDFSGGPTGWLDEWVFARFEAFMGRVAMGAGESYHRERLHRSGIVFFLHLLATDIAGHTFKPHAQEYQKNVNLIDTGVKKVVDLLEDFYGNDGKTAYILTADHGMTDWGSHGAGDASETQTPLVAWGAGVPQAVPSGSPACREAQRSPRHDGWPRLDDEHGWELSGVCRQDTWQADIAPLMSTLIGVPIPVNSVGYLRRSYLALGGEEMAQAAFTNARQVLRQHVHRRAQMERPWAGYRWLSALTGWLPSLYRPYAALLPHDEASRLASISRHIDAGSYEKAVLESDELFALASSGLEYHHRYHKMLLLTATSVSFAAWILLLLALATWGDGNLDQVWAAIGGCKLNFVTDLPMAFLSTCMTCYLFLLALPLQYYVYCLLPFALCWSIARLVSHWCANGKGCGIEWGDRWGGVLPSALLALAYLVGIEILVLCFFRRWALSVGMAGLIIIPLARQQRRSTTSLYWAASCLLLGVFPFVPVVGRDVDTPHVVTSGLLIVALGMLAALVQDGHGLHPCTLVHCWPLWVPLALLLPLATWNVAAADESFAQNRGLPLACQGLSWILSACSVALPLLVRWHPSPGASLRKALTQQLLTISLSVAVPYILLSVDHEGFFLLALTINMHAWVLVEIDMNPREAQHSQVSWDNMRMAYTFMFLIMTSFFGTGNVASINSFDPAWVRRFLSVFSPHAMGALILAKTCIPFLLVSCAFRAVTLILKAQTKQLFLMVLALSDASGLHFLHLVTDKGSWMDIGSSLSHFVIQEAMALFLLILYALSCACMPIASVKAPEATLVTSVSLSIGSLEEEHCKGQRSSWMQKSKRS